MPIVNVQRKTYVTSANAASVDVTWDTQPREGNLLVLIINGDGGPDTDTLEDALGWDVARQADNITGLYLLDKLAGADEAVSFTVPFEASVSSEIVIWEFTSNADSPRDITASDTTAPSFTAEVSSGSTSPEWAGMSQADEYAIAVFARAGSGFAASSFTNGFAQELDLEGAGSNATSMIVATRALTDQLDALETTATISGGSLAPSGLLVTYKARLAGPVARSLRQRYEEAPNAQDVAITNTGDGTLAWTASADVEWLELSPEAGTAPSTMNVKASAEGLVPDVYEGQVEIAATGASNTPQTIPVTFTVSPETREVGNFLPQPYRVEGAVAAVEDVYVISEGSWVSAAVRRVVDGVWT